MPSNFSLNTQYQTNIVFNGLIYAGNICSLKSSCYAVLSSLFNSARKCLICTFLCYLVACRCRYCTPIGFMKGNVFLDFYIKQECIPVGCVPAARRPYAGVCFGGGGGFLPARGGSPCRGGSSLPGGVPPCRGGSLCQGGFLPAGGGVLPARGGFSLPGGVLPARGGSPENPPCEQNE